MQDSRFKMDKRLILAIVFFLTAAAAFSGCGSGLTEQEEGMEELSLTEDGGELTGDTGDDGDAPDGNSGKNGDDPAGTSGADEPDRAGEEETVFVYICGAVNTPGVYELKKDARVFEAIRSAGGMTEEAAADAVNQARPVSDGEQIYVPTTAEAESLGTGVEGTVTEGTVNSKVNINTAGKEELMTLTGIGEAKAESILKYRDENGKFGSIEELMEIEGIKEGVFGKIKDDITI